MRMNLSAEVRKLSKEMNVSFTEIARRTGQSPANLSKKLSRETLSFEDFEKILEALGVQLECRMILPGEGGAIEAAPDRRTEGRIAILEKELELERLRNDYYRDSGFALRTALETISGSIDLLDGHSEDPARVKRCVSRMRVALGQLMRIAGDEMAAEADRKAEPMPGQIPGGRRVLVVDDNAINRDIVADLLADSGLAAEEAGDGAEALEMVKAMPEDHYQLILMDLVMPVMDGYEAARSLRRLSGSRGRIPIVAMTAGDAGDDRQRAAAAGMEGFIQKPLNLQRLLEAVASL